MALLELVTTSINIAVKVWQRCQQVSAYREDCKELGSLVRRVQALLEDVRKDSGQLDSISNNQGFQAVKEALQGALVVVEECAQKGTFIAFIFAGNLNGKFKAASLKLDRALALLQVTTLGAVQRNKNVLMQLCQDFERAQYVESRAREEQFRHLRSQMEEMLHQARMQGKQQVIQGDDLRKVRQMLEALVSSSGQKLTQQKLEAELSELYRQVANARRTKDAMEERMLEQIIAALSLGSSGDKVAQLQFEPLTHFTCPLSMEVMRDPVMVVASGHTYDRKSIEEHFKRSAIEPLTGVALKDLTLAPNHALRGAIEEWQRASAKEAAKLENKQAYQHKIVYDYFEKIAQGTTSTSTLKLQKAIAVASVKRAMDKGFMSSDAAKAATIAKLLGKK